ncbi:MAG: 50S ribosomal protein L5 [Planctomycetes bacterium]|nr:50S ribosomal protein L5 [Planctomycetota bacterium]
MARLLERYRSEIRPTLMKEFGFTNVHAFPRLMKVTVNMGIGKARENPKHLEEAVRDLATITGQKPIVTRARKSIAQFHLREGYPVGCCVTLRGRRMYEFLDRLISVTVPRIRDFRGLPDRLDGGGNYSMGLQDQVVFPEVDADRVEHVQGMNITMRISGGRDDVSRRLLEALGMPFRRPEDKEGA